MYHVPNDGSKHTIFITIAMYVSSVLTYCTLNQMTLEGFHYRAPNPNCEVLIVIKKQGRYPGTLRHGISQSNTSWGMVDVQ